MDSQSSVPVLVQIPNTTGQANFEGLNLSALAQNMVSKDEIRDMVKMTLGTEALNRSAIEQQQKEEKPEYNPDEEDAGVADNRKKGVVEEKDELTAVQKEKVSFSKQFAGIITSKGSPNTWRIYIEAAKNKCKDAVKAAIRETWLDAKVDDLRSFNIDDPTKTWTGHKCRFEWNAIRNIVYRLGTPKYWDKDHGALKAWREKIGEEKKVNATITKWNHLLKQVDETNTLVRVPYYATSSIFSMLRGYSGLEKSIQQIKALKIKGETGETSLATGEALTEIEKSLTECHAKIFSIFNSAFPEQGQTYNDFLRGDKKVVNPRTRQYRSHAPRSTSRSGSKGSAPHSTSRSKSRSNGRISNSKNNRK